MEKYTLKVLKPEYWQRILDNLQYTSDGKNHVPSRAVDCIDGMGHSPTRGTFELTEKEAEELKKNDWVEWIELSRLHHLDQYPKPEPDTVAGEFAPVLVSSISLTIGSIPLLTV